jgi:hypothetical protein
MEKPDNGEQRTVQAVARVLGGLLSQQDYCWGLLLPWPVTEMLGVVQSG